MNESKIDKYIDRIQQPLSSEALKEGFLKKLKLIRQSGLVKVIKNGSDSLVKND